MKFKCEIDMSNAAFDDEFALTRCLNKICTQIKQYGFEEAIFAVMDENGNKVGKWEITED